MKYFKINQKILFLIIFTIFFLQTILIAHRNSFSINLLNNFYKENAGMEQGIKNKKILRIINIIKKNNLTNYKLSEKLLKSIKIKQRVFEGSYPARFKKHSKYLITDNLQNDCEIKDRIKNIYLMICE